MKTTENATKKAFSVLFSNLSFYAILYTQQGTAVFADKFQKG